MKAKKWVVVKDFHGLPKEENVKLVEFDLPDELKEGEILLQAVYLSVDPYMRLFPSKESQDMGGEQLSEVIKTRNGQYPLGTLVLSHAGWVSHYISKGEGLNPIRFDIGSTPKSYTLGALGMPGATAYLALNQCQPKVNEVIVISAAAGAVGNLVGQLAKLKGLKVIGIVGSEEKLKWCRDELGFDHVINYKTEDFSQAICRLAPDGADIYFDNVGGDFYHTIVNHHMRKLGRVLVCGSIQTYNNVETKLYPITNVSILVNCLHIMGFIIFDHVEEMPDAHHELNKLIQQGKIKVKETTYVGIEKMYEAFSGLFKGENIGKAIVKAVNQQTNYP